jgi:hypothetical protein
MAIHKVSVINFMGRGDAKVSLILRGGNTVMTAAKFKEIIQKQ